MSEESGFVAPKPFWTASVDGGPDLPCDWRMEGSAYAPADWSVTVHGGEVPPWNWKTDPHDVRFTTPLGVMRGPGVLVSAEESGGDISSRLLGSGPLTLDGAGE